MIKIDELTNKFPEIKKTEYGFFKLKNLPEQNELKTYYSKKYYQKSKGAYDKNYSSQEKQFLVNKIDQKYRIVKEFLDTDEPRHSLLDIGCGEGWAMRYFHQKGWKVQGLDYSDYGLRLFNPHLSNHLIKGDIYENLNYLIHRKRKFDLIWLTNVLEHVLEPEKLVQDLKRLCMNRGILLIQVPNDFSDLQMFLIDRAFIKSPFWIVTPDHISYFSKDSLVALLESFGWNTCKLISDFPIDFNLFNEKTNYVKDMSVGRSVHLARVEIENYLHRHDPERTNKLYELMAEMGIGRQISGFFMLDYK